MGKCLKCERIKVFEAIISFLFILQISVRNVKIFVTFEVIFRVFISKLCASLNQSMIIILLINFGSLAFVIKIYKTIMIKIVRSMP